MIWWWGSPCTRPTRLIWFVVALAHWNNSPCINMSHHSDTLSWFLANQSLLFILNDACLATNTNFTVFVLTQPEFETTIYHTRGEHTNHYTTDAVARNIKPKFNKISSCTKENVKPFGVFHGYNVDNVKFGRTSLIEWNIVYKFGKSRTFTYKGKTIILKNQLISYCGFKLKWRAFLVNFKKKLKH